MGTFPGGGARNRGEEWKLRAGGVWGLRALGATATLVPPRFELSPRMREACLIVKTHLGHPTATKSKEVVSRVLQVGCVPPGQPSPKVGLQCSHQHFSSRSTA